ncbi:MAG TPA: DUF805 domain-containing protein [Telluria sp.]|jgi:uncharacterized membrane protein YhaH (DUF805 family)
MSNIYAAPQADMSNPAGPGDTYVPNMLQMTGRIGRVRYLVYCWLVPFVILFLAGVAFVFLFRFIGPIMSFLSFVLWIPAVFAVFVVTRRRLHDLNLSGWYGLLQLVPLVNLVFGLWLVFAPGTEGANEYGLPARDVFGPMSW